MIIGRIGWGTKMRTRLIKPDFFIDEDIASLEPLLRIFMSAFGVRPTEKVGFGTVLEI